MKENQAPATAQPAIYRMKRTAESSFIQYISPDANEKRWFRYFAANIATQELYPEPTHIERKPTDILQEIPKEVLQYEMALLNSQVWEQSGALAHCLLLPQRLPDILNAIQPTDKLLLYVFTENCGVCKFTTPLVSHLAYSLNDYENNNVYILALHGYTDVLALTGLQWINDNLGVPKFYLFENGERRTLHNPDLLGDYNPDETYRRIAALFEKEA
ncbi:MAG TPA: thioredoxin family protein [Chitinophagales bacterium]|nr:thioredoxin family protein [Chitinophagales bacterium]